MRLAEQSGRLVFCLKLLVQSPESQRRPELRLKAALTYPAFPCLGSPAIVTVFGFALALSNAAEA